MNKADLKIKWGSYCDTDKLVDDVMSLLTKYNHRNTEHGVCVMLNTYFTNKQDLIDMLKKSPSYIGDMRIALDIELERTNNNREIRDFCISFAHAVDAQAAILKHVDEDGKTIDDYSKTGISTLKASDLLKENVRAKLTKNHEGRSRFDNDGVTKASRTECNNFNGVMRTFANNPSTLLGASTVDMIKQYKINGSFTAGMKTSRAFNRVCTSYGVEKLPKYNKLFATYSDMVSGLKRKMKFFISVNPLDYLTMSFGNSWASCHTIDKRNTRGMPNDYSGAYCGGTVSYMLDGTSIITYVYNSMPESYEDGKVYRTMFHYNDGTLVQGRVYPQGNDGATDLYKVFRNCVQDEIGKLIGATASNWVKSSRNCGHNTQSLGVHYRDYLYQSDCNVSYVNTISDSRDNIVRIGHQRVCPYCGEYIYDNEDTGKLSHRCC